MIKTILAATVAILTVTSVQAADLGNYQLSVLGGTTVRNDIDRNSADVVEIKLGRDLTKQVRGDLGWNRNLSGDKTALGEVKTDAILGGLYYDFANKSKFTPFVGVNAGYGWGEGAGVSATNDSGFMWGGTAGVAYGINDRWNLVGKYQYLRSADIEVENYAGVDKDFESHAIVGGIRLDF